LMKYLHGLGIPSFIVIATGSTANEEARERRLVREGSASTAEMCIKTTCQCVYIVTRDTYEKHHH